MQPGSSIVRSRETRRASGEYVSGGAGNWTGGRARALPSPIDDLTSDFGSEIYEQMLLDAQVAACVTILKASILEDGLILAPAIDDQDDKQYKRAVEIRDAAELMFERLETPLDDVLWALLDALAYGNKVAELISEIQTVDGKQYLHYRAIKVKPRELVAFVVDDFMNVLGLLGAKPGQSTVPGTGLGVRIADVLPRDKFAVLTFRPQDGDPRGTSVLRAAYEPWWRKRQLSPEYLKYLSQFAGPSVWATPPEDVSISPSVDSLGNLVDGSGETVDDASELSEADQPLSPQDELLAVLLAWRNGTAMTVPFGTQVHTVEMQGEGEAFLSAFVQADAQITKAILTQSLATEEGEHQARAAASVHQDVLDTLVRQGKRCVLRMIGYDILVPWVLRNWGEKAARELVPIPSLGSTERQDLPQLWTAAAALQRSNYLHPSQHPAVDEMLSLPVRDQTQAPQLQPVPNPAPGEPSAPGGQQQGTGGPGAPSGPAERGGRGAAPAADALVLPERVSGDDPLGLKESSDDPA